MMYCIDCIFNQWPIDNRVCVADAKVDIEGMGANTECRCNAKRLKKLREQDAGFAELLAAAEALVDDIAFGITKNGDEENLRAAIAEVKANNYESPGK
jgi:uncharacterized protein YdcH (DUF465 family)